MSTRERNQEVKEPLSVQKNGIVIIQFSDRVIAETIYQAVYDPEVGSNERQLEEEDMTKVIDGQVVVSVGDTMAFSLRGKGPIRTLVVRNYREQSTKNNVRDPGASIKEPWIDDSDVMRGRNVKSISSDKPEVEIDGIGEFRWEELSRQT